MDRAIWQPGEVAVPVEDRAASTISTRQKLGILKKAPAALLTSSEDGIASPQGSQHAVYASTFAAGHQTPAPEEQPQQRKDRAATSSVAQEEQNRIT